MIRKRLLSVLNITVKVVVEPFSVRKGDVVMIIVFRAMLSSGH